MFQELLQQTIMLVTSNHPTIKEASHSRLTTMLAALVK